MSGDTYGQSYRRIKEREKVLTQKTGREVYREFTAVNGRDYLALGGKLEDLKELPEADDYMAVKFTVDVGVARELIRHRQMSFMERSTRYCNMAGGVEFIKPVPFAWAEFNPESDNAGNYTNWLDVCFNAEKVYMRMIKRGARPQEARTSFRSQPRPCCMSPGCTTNGKICSSSVSRPERIRKCATSCKSSLSLANFRKTKSKPEFEHSEKKN